jgi:hypothetical protein
MTGLKQVFMPTVIDVDGTPTALGVTSKEIDAWDVLRAFFGKAEDTEFVGAFVEVWEVDYIGEEPRTELGRMVRRPCPICERSSFWEELGEPNYKGERRPNTGRCHRPECSAWIEVNTVDAERWDCGWPAAQWTKRVESYNLGIRGLVEMRGAVTAAGKQRRSTMSSELMEDL